MLWPMQQMLMMRALSVNATYFTTSLHLIGRMRLQYYLNPFEGTDCSARLSNSLSHMCRHKSAGVNPVLMMQKVGKQP